MAKDKSNYRWFVVGTFFIFMLLHQTDMLMIGSLQIPISETFGIGNLEWGFINTGALIVGTMLYPVWGYLYDHYARSKLLALASLIWGLTTWISAVARSYPMFLVTRASTGIDDSSYPGLYTLISDYFPPNIRGTIYGILQLTQPIGFLLGMILALMVAPLLGDWRSLFYFTGTLGLFLAVAIFFGIKEPPRGKTEPEFEAFEEEQLQVFKFSWKEVKQIFKNKTMWFIYLQGFMGYFPWNVIIFFFFGYLATERGYNDDQIFFTMAPAILLIALGYYIGGMVGDKIFKYTKKGRILVSSMGVFFSALFFYLAMTTPVLETNLFFVYLCLTAIFLPLSTPNMVATVYDVIVPEVRSSAQSIEHFFETLGATLAPAITGILAEMIGLPNAITYLCISTWGLCFILFFGVLFFIEGDIKILRSQMVERAESL